MSLNYNDMNYGTEIIWRQMFNILLNIINFWKWRQRLLRDLGGILR